MKRSRFDEEQIAAFVGAPTTTFLARVRFPLIPVCGLSVCSGGYEPSPLRDWTLFVRALLDPWADANLTTRSTDGCQPSRRRESIFARVDADLVRLSRAIPRISEYILYT